MRKQTLIGLVFFLCLVPARAQEMAWERLPDLDIPRAGHTIVYLNGELTVIGGHTTGFIPTPTAEYYKNGKWNTVSSFYTHDGGFCLPLKDGTVLLGGGLSEAFGVGQSFSVESYRPDTHSFDPVSILDRKRAAANAAELEDGTILVSGNWYADDALEQYSARDGFVQIKEVAETRCYPWILPTAPDNALIFSSADARGKYAKGWVDRLRGEPFQEPLLVSYRPMVTDGDIKHIPCEIGDPSKGDYDYLLLAINESDEANGILRVHGEAFSLLELESEIPHEGLGGPIQYYTTTLKHNDAAWVLGTDPSKRVYLLQICYKPALEGGKATLRLYHTEPLKDLPRYGACAMLPDGRVVMAGGIDYSNYTPYASVFIFNPFQIQSGSSFSKTAGLIAGTLTALLLYGLGWWLARRKKKTAPERPAPSQTDSKEQQRDRALFEKVSALMEDGLYTQKGLSITHLATSLGTNTKYISSCINAGAGCSFFEYVNGYRIRYAKQLLLEKPDIRLSEIAETTGFASETAFYRNFKLLTGLTPAEWLRQQ